MALNWSTTNKSVVNGVNVLVYGNPGVGKTRLCATAPNPMIISVEGGMLSLRDKNIPYVEVKNLDDLHDAYQYFAKNGKGSQDFDTICLDSISEIAEVVLSAAKKNVKDARQAYGALLDQMMAIIRLFRDLNRYNCYFSAKMESAKDEESGIIRWGPSMPGSKLSVQIPYLFDEVFAMRTARDEAGKPYSYLQTELDLQYVAKDRSGALAAIERPDLTHVFNKIRGSK